MAIQLSIIPSEIGLIEACFDERQVFLKRESWSGFRSAFGPFLSGRERCCREWRQDRQIFGGFIRRRAAYLRERGPTFFDQAKRFSSLEYGSLQEEIRALLLYNTFESLECRPDQNAVHHLALLSAQFARADVPEELQAIISACHDQVDALVGDCPALSDLATRISRQDSRFSTHTAWQILFATTESTALSIEAALALKLGALLPPSGVELDCRSLATAESVLQVSLIYFPSTYDMVFDLEDRIRGIGMPGGAPASIHVPVDLANRALGKHDGRYRQSNYGFTFGGGPRRCPGKSLALVEAAAILRALIQQPPRDMPKHMQYVRRGFFAHLVR